MYLPETRVGTTEERAEQLSELYIDQLSLIEKIAKLDGYEPEEIEVFKQIHLAHFEYDQGINRLQPRDHLEMIAKSSILRKDMERTAEVHGDRSSREAVRLLARDSRYSDFMQELYLVEIRPHITGGNA